MRHRSAHCAAHFTLSLRVHGFLRFIYGDAENNWAAFDKLDELVGGEACPVCACISRVLDQWVELTDKAARIGLGLWTVFPTCPTHIWICAHLCGSATAHQVARYVSKIMIESLQRAVAAMAREDQEREIASKSVWFKQKSPSYLLGQRRKLVTRMPRCPACECFAVARDRAIGRILDLDTGSTAPTYSRTRARTVSEAFRRRLLDCSQGRGSRCPDGHAHGEALGSEAGARAAFRTLESFQC
jgi:hypothetical protein